MREISKATANFFISISLALIFNLRTSLLMHIFRVFYQWMYLWQIVWHRWTIVSILTWRTKHSLKTLKKKDSRFNEQHLGY